MFLLPLLPLPAQLALIALSAVGFDLGIQGDADRAPNHRLRSRSGGPQPLERPLVHRRIHRHGERRRPQQPHSGKRGLAGRRGAGDGCGAVALWIRSGRKTARVAA